MYDLFFGKVSIGELESTKSLAIYAIYGFSKIIRNLSGFESVVIVSDKIIY